eukprot:gene11267-19799_t
MYNLRQLDRARVVLIPLEENVCQRVLVSVLDTNLRRYEAWHEWSMLHYRAIVSDFRKDSGMTDVIISETFMAAVQGFLHAIQLGSTSEIIVLQ